jgi:hypothetical protein
MGGRSYEKYSIRMLSKTERAVAGNEHAERSLFLQSKGQCYLHAAAQCVARLRGLMIQSLDGLIAG